MIYDVNHTPINLRWFVNYIKLLKHNINFFALFVSVKSMSARQGKTLNTKEFTPCILTVVLNQICNSTHQNEKNINAYKNIML